MNFYTIKFFTTYFFKNISLYENCVVCVCACALSGMQAHVCMCMYVYSPEVDFRCFLYSLTKLSFEVRIPMNLKLTDVTSQLVRGSRDPPVSASQYWDCMCTKLPHLAFYVDPRDPCQILKIVQQTLIEPCPHPQMKTSLTFHTKFLESMIHSILALQLS